jgi:anti-anti-sigma regulatory factor
MVKGTRKRTRKATHRLESEVFASAVRGKAPVGARAQSRVRSQPAMKTVSLPGDCTIRDASVLHRMLLEALHLKGPVSIDGSAVERVDTSGLQLLLAFVRDRRHAGRQSAWAKRSTALSAAVELSGLATQLDLSAIEVA